MRTFFVIIFAIVVFCFPCAAEEGTVIFENACGRFLTRMPSIAPVSKEIQGLIDSEVNEWKKRLKNEETISWATVKGNMERIEQRDKQIRERFVAFAAKYGVICGTTGCYSSPPRDKRKYLQEWDVLRAAGIAVGRVRLLILKSAGAAAEKEFGQIYAGEGPSGEAPTATFGRIINDLQTLMRQLDVLPYRQSDLTYRSLNGHGYWYRQYSPDDYLKALELATKLGAGAKVVAELRLRGVAQGEPDLGCRIDP